MAEFGPPDWRRSPSRSRSATSGRPPAAKNLLGPGDRVRVGALAGEEQGVHRLDVVVLEQRRLGVLLAHRAEGGRRREECGDLVLLDDPPERARVRRADRLALIEHARAAVQQRAVDDVGMADDPADVGRGPVGVARPDVIDRRHRPFQCDDIAADIAHHPFGHAGRAGRVEDIERIGRREIGAGPVCRPPWRRRQRLPIVIAARVDGRRNLRALVNDARRRLVLGEGDGEIEQRLVFDDAAGLDSATRRQNDFRLGVVDARRQLLCGESAEYDRMHRADAR